MTDKETEKAEENLAAEYVLGTLRGEQRSQFEEAIEKDPEIDGEVNEWQNRLSPLSKATPSVMPPKRVWDGIERRLSHALPEVVEDNAAPSWWSSLSLWRGVAIATVFGLGLAVSPLLQQAVDDEIVVASSISHVVMRDKQDNPLWMMACNWDTGRMQITLVTDKAVASDKSQELWVLAKDGSNPISLGLLEGDEMVFNMPKNVEWSNTKAFAVSLEPLGGSTTGLPTGPVLYVAPVLPAAKA